MANCTKECRPKLELAKHRLRDAELRNSQIYAIVDSFIGIEALLNPDNTPELTLRVALNYSTLGLKNEAHERFKKLKDMYKVRSKIVHGDHKPDVPYKVAGLPKSIDEIAMMSKEVLRELVRKFAEDDQLRLIAKLDIEYWERRYFRHSHESIDATVGQ